MLTFLPLQNFQPALLLFLNEGKHDQVQNTSPCLFQCLPLEISPCTIFNHKCHGIGRHGEKAPQSRQRRLAGKVHSKFTANWTQDRPINLPATFPDIALFYYQRLPRNRALPMRSKKPLSATSLRSPFYIIALSLCRPTTDSVPTGKGAGEPR